MSRVRKNVRSGKICEEWEEISEDGKDIRIRTKCKDSDKNLGVRENFRSRTNY